MPSRMSVDLDSQLSSIHSYFNSASVNMGNTPRVQLQSLNGDLEMRSVPRSMSHVDPQSRSLRAHSSASSLSRKSASGPRRFPRTASGVSSRATRVQAVDLSTADLSSLEMSMESGDTLSTAVPPAILELLENNIQKRKATRRQLQTCESCSMPLASGRVHRNDKQVLCENCYVEKCGPCQICSQPLEDVPSSIRASVGSRVHKKCANCFECSAKLVEYHTVPIQDNKVLCLQDFINSLAPKCTLCSHVILEDHVKVLNLPFHQNCLVCKGDCGLSLVDQNIVLDQKMQPFCQTDFIQHSKTMVCKVCTLPIEGRRVAKAGKDTMHRHCVACKICGLQMNGNEKFYVADDPPALVCAADYEKRYAPVCQVCGVLIKATAARTRVGKLSYHLECMRCHTCSKTLVNQTIYRRRGHLYCEVDYKNKSYTSVKCEVCSNPIQQASEGVKIKGKKIHKTCVRCSVCEIQLGRVGQVVYVADNELVCHTHYLQKREKRASLAPHPIRKKAA